MAELKDSIELKITIDSSSTPEGIAEEINKAVAAAKRTPPPPRMTVDVMCRRAHDNSTNKGFWDSRLFELVLDKAKAGGLERELAEQFVEHYLELLYATKIALIMSEGAEALEALRKGDLDNLTEELADIAIRVGDLSKEVAFKPLSVAIAEKMEINEKRPTKHGKRF